MNPGEKQVTIKCRMVRDPGTSVTEPRYATSGSAGMDLAACLDKPVTLAPGEIVKIGTGIAIQLPDQNYAAMVFPRSGNAARHGITLANAVGVVDSDYTGEILCPVINLSKEPYTINPGDRIAQLVIVPITIARLEYVTELDATKRGDRGFGSTGR
ncbi:MAG: dUTP diphosphatase [Clostridia bacterium]|nr:dUTP diphosphatase [Clostridia bacterium]